MVLVEEDYYCSDSDDDDVDRYVFLARQPPPAGRHAEDDRDVSSENDDDDVDGGHAMSGGEESDGGVDRRKKRTVREITDDAPPPPKKARVELTVTSPLVQTPPSGSESDSAPSPRCVRAEESGSEGSDEKAHHAPREVGEAKSTTEKKRGACGKRARGPSCEGDGDRDSRRAVPTAAKTGASLAAAPGRFLCNLCDRCFDTFQELGGHVLGHRKKAKQIAITGGAAGLGVEDAGGIGNHREEIAAVNERKEATNGIAKIDKAVVAARRVKANGKGDSDIGEHVFAGGSDEDADGNDGLGNKRSPIAVPSHGFTKGSSRSDKKMDTGVASPMVVGTRHDGANGNSNVCRTRYKCKVCDTECLTGCALGGHMRKHRKRSPLGGGCGEGKPPPSSATDEDCQVPLAQLFGAETSLERENRFLD